LACDEVAGGHSQEDFIPTTGPAGLAAGHVAAALYHQFIRKDRLLLRRMRAER